MCRYHKLYYSVMNSCAMSLYTSNVILCAVVNYCGCGCLLVCYIVCHSKLLWLPSSMLLYLDTSSFVVYIYLLAWETYHLFISCRWFSLNGTLLNFMVTTFLYNMLHHTYHMSAYKITTMVKIAGYNSSSSCSSNSSNHNNNSN